MSQEVYWLTLTALMTALFWMPYVLNRIALRGLLGTMGNPPLEGALQTPWAERARAAHRNAVENLALFAPLVLAIQVMGLGDALTATACMVYFFARAAHFVVYTAGVPVLRTLAFFGGFAAQVVLALRLLGLV